MYILAYLEIPITVWVKNLAKRYDKGTLIKINPGTGIACVGAYQIKLNRSEYAIIQ